MVRCVTTLLLLMLANATLGDDARRVAAAIQASVPRVIAATVQVDSGSDLSSGAIVSKDGYVLTVAHGLRHEGRKATVRLASGERVDAAVVFQNRKADVAVLKMANTNQRNYAFLAIASTPPDVSAAVLACGFPAREEASQSSVLRLGHVTRQDTSLIRSTCVLTAGDSGGPLVNVDGQLLGIHQRIGVGRESNLHLTMDACRTAVMSAIDLSRHVNVEQQSQVSRERIAIPPEVVQKWDQHAVTVLDTSDQTLLAHGTLVISNAVITKLSRLAMRSDVVVRLNGGTQSEATVVLSDIPLDVAVLKLARNAEVADIPDSVGSNVVGQLVFSSHDGSVGIVSRTDHVEAPSTPKLGCGLIETNGQLLVDDVAANSAASDFGLREGDQIQELSRQAMSSLDDVAQFLQPLQPGDWLSVAFLRSAESRHGQGALRHPPSELLSRSEFLDGNAGRLSNRRTGFTHILQHDMALSATQMGSPLLAIDGQLMAVNIARRSRESVLAIPIQRVQQIVNEALKSDAAQ